MGAIAKIFGMGKEKPRAVAPIGKSPAEIQNEAELSAQKQLAEDKKKRKGFAATIATSSQGLGGSDSDSNVKTLLG